MHANIYLEDAKKKATNHSLTTLSQFCVAHEGNKQPSDWAAHLYLLIALIIFGAVFDLFLIKLFSIFVFIVFN